MVAQVIVLVLLVGLATVSHAVETDVDVGVEFTEITGNSKPIKPPRKAAHEPIKKVIRLPQTSTNNDRKWIILGVLTSISVMSLLCVRKNEVLNNEIK